MILLCHPWLTTTVQQPIFPIGVLLLKLSPQPRAVLLVSISYYYPHSFQRFPAWLSTASHAAHWSYIEFYHLLDVSQKISPCTSCPFLWVDAANHLQETSGDLVQKMWKSTVIFGRFSLVRKCAQHCRIKTCLLPCLPHCCTMAHAVLQGFVRKTNSKVV